MIKWCGRVVLFNICRWALDFFAWSPAVLQCFLPFSWDAPAAKEQKLHALALYLARVQRQFSLAHPSKCETRLVAESLVTGAGSREAPSRSVVSRNRLASSLAGCHSLFLEVERGQRPENVRTGGGEREETCTAEAEASEMLRRCSALVSLEVFRDYVSGRCGSWWSHGCVLRFLCRCLFLRVVSLNTVCLFLKDALR